MITTLLHKRGIREAGDIERFLKPDFVRDTHDPFLLHDMERAVARIFAAIVAREKIAIYGDFDCDGIPGASVLWDFFAKIGYLNIEVYIPHRDREGYGFHSAAVDELSKKDVSLIVTVDVGGAAVDTVDHAKKLGIDVIICDHHEV
ncbi:MAG: DHH family phosphoesterase, partial [bacterium]|nr:DHH family phosphoesterase [bacterium]